MTPDAFQAFATDPDLDGVDLRVLFYLLGHLTTDSFKAVPQIDIAAALGRRKQHISRSIRKLEAKGIIIPAGPRVGRSIAWRLNPSYK